MMFKLSFSVWALAAPAPAAECDGTSDVCYIKVGFFGEGGFGGLKTYDSTSPDVAIDDLPARPPKREQPPAAPPRNNGGQTLVPARSKWATATKTSDGTEICKNKQDQRGCPHGNSKPGGCEKGKAHVCDVMLATGKVCASSSHTRPTHDVTKHGMPQIKS